MVFIMKVAYNMEMVKRGTLTKISDFIVIQKKLTLTTLKKKQLQISWEIHRKPLYRVPLFMKLLYQNIILCVDNVVA